MPFLLFSKSNGKFGAKKLTLRLYTAAETLPTVKRIELINKHEFIKIAFDKNANTFVVHVTALRVPESTMLMHNLQALLLAAL